MTFVNQVDGIVRATTATSLVLNTGAQTVYQCRPARGDPPAR
jgi:hypothetical protein